jgi:hypothetical protein
MTNFNAADPEVLLLPENREKLAALLRDIKRLQSQGRLDFNDEGLMLEGHVNMTIGGVFHSDVLRHELVQKAVEDGDPDQEFWARNFVAASGMARSGYGYTSLGATADHNLLPTAGLNFVLNVLFYSTSKIATWYFGPFTDDKTPVAGWLSSWAGAISGPLATELTDAQITGGARAAATFGVTATAAAIATSAATALTLETGVTGLSLYGATLNESSTIAYNVADKILLAATRFSTAKTGLGAADIINLNYSIAATST